MITLKPVKRQILQSLDRLLRNHGYYIKPQGTDFKKINILDLTEFGALARAALQDKTSFLKEDRLHILWQAVRQTLPFDKDLAEVGVFRGGSAKFIAEIMRWHHKDHIGLHLFDTFEGMPDNLAPVDTRSKGGFENTSLELVTQYLSDFPNVKFYRGLFEDNAHRVDHCLFSLVHIDVDIYNSYRSCLHFFDQRLVAGGMMVLDDYGFTTCPGARQAVDEFMSLHGNDYYFFHIETGQGLLIKRSSPRRLPPA
jgi:O-methyltransferase